MIAATFQRAGLEGRVVEEIGRRGDELLDLLATLVGFDTRAPDPDYAPRDEAALQAHVAARLRAVGMEVDVWEPDSASLRPTRYAIPDDHTFRGRPQLVARAPGVGSGRRLLLNGHIDVVTVEPRAAWSGDPFRARRVDGRLVGRGACDMKGGVAAMVFAAQILRELEVPLLGELIVNTVTDEESTGAGSLACARAGVAADGGIITEPTELTAWLGTRGSLMPTITVHGRAGHAAYPYDGTTPGEPVNALEKLQLVIRALFELREEWQRRPDLKHPHLKTGSIVPVAVDAGQWIVSQPATATLRCHVQYLPGQGDAEGFGAPVEREIEERVLAATAGDPWLAEQPPTFAWAGDAPAGCHEPGEPVAATLLDTMQALGLPGEIGTRTTFFDGPTFSLAGTPTIAFGPGDMRIAHTIDEWVPTDEVVRAAQVLAVTAMRFCGVAGA
jgi:acetylornithine deacetylase